MRIAHNADNQRGYLLVHHDWYEFPDEPDPLRRNAIVSTLQAEAPPVGAQIVKRGYQILEPLDVMPFAFTICECRPIQNHPFDSLDEAENCLRSRGVRRPHVGFNPIG